MDTESRFQEQGKHPAADTESFSQRPLEELVAEIDRDSRAREPRPPEDQGARQYIRFFLEDVFLAVPLSGVLEIGHLPDITPLPNLPEWLLGVSNIRGEIVSIVDLKVFFGLSFRKGKRNRRLIVVRNPEMKTGILVDRIMGILSSGRSDATLVQDSPYSKETSGSELAPYISGLLVPESRDEKILNIFDIDKFLSCPRMTAFRSEK